MTTDAVVPDPDLTIAEAGRRMRAGELSAQGLTRSILDRANALNVEFGAYVTVLADLALAQAESADRDFAAGIDHGPLQGIPVAVKDIIAVRDIQTSANSRIMDPGWCAGVDATAVDRLRHAGVVFVGKATTNEFAVAMPDADTEFPMPRNPWNIDHTPAGSSSGTAIAVAVQAALGGLASDTGGSIRMPASANGVTGLKVTKGRVPMAGVYPLAPSLDTVGPMARTAQDCALLLSTIAGRDATDPSSASAAVPHYADDLSLPSDMKIAIPMPYFFENELLEPDQRMAVETAIENLVDLGACKSEVVLDHPAEAVHANHVILVSEGLAHHRRNLSARWSEYGRATRQWLAYGALYSAADYIQANRFRDYWARQVAQVLTMHDVIVTPTTPGPAERLVDLKVSDRIRRPNFTVPWNLAGLPAVAIPVGLSAAGLPLSMQIIGRPFAEQTVLRVAHAFQEVTDHHRRLPSGSLA